MCHSGLLQFLKYSLSQVTGSLRISTSATQDQEIPHLNRQTYVCSWPMTKVSELRQEARCTKVTLSMSMCIPFCIDFRIDCLIVGDIVNGLNAGAKYPTFTIPKGYRSKVWSIFNLGNIFEKNALKIENGLMAKISFFIIPDTRNTQ